MLLIMGTETEFIGTYTIVNYKLTMVNDVSKFKQIIFSITYYSINGAIN